MSYDARTLVTFKVFSNLAGTVWTKASLWKMMGTLLLIALTVAACIAVMVKDPAKLNVARFQRISSFLEVVVGLLLGFFLSSSMQRWYSCTNGFLELFDAIRGLHMQLNAMGVSKEKVQLCLRYCVVSAHCLNHDLTASPMTPEDAAEYLASCWADLTVEKEALLEVAVCIAQPFAIAGKGVAPGRIPTEKLLQHLEKDLKDIEFMSTNLPWWNQATRIGGRVNQGLGSLCGGKERSMLLTQVEQVEQMLKRLNE
ncbi:tRNA (Cytosine(34)-C(5))-methyltransferase [Durusdinium trenchii]|uniref:tRNA (Cytosine(34)-C(5))-methyltransferase n=1 Tax=Durusdinium trenchii TaxID=1381693 RepID=A0ABP0QH99_9DINO